ncbi:hypothetical protein A4A49_07715 [Nicotiana attenuata]|uniref:Uncharacterized protein n=1 Tax=Nicotiana attenuata TaxID=49451 RepID=A0A1J6IT01_NICAT|nr:hypothetical protein A4A49_07715 [Nicotiana attenuata]
MGRLCPFHFCEIPCFNILLSESHLPWRFGQHKKPRLHFKECRFGLCIKDFIQRSNDFCSKFNRLVRFPLNGSLALKSSL